MWVWGCEDICEGVWGGCKGGMFCVKIGTFWKPFSTDYDMLI